MINSNRVSPNMLRMAEKGDVQKQFEVGMIYLNPMIDKPTSAEVQEGISWLLRAAEHGHTQATTVLGGLQTTGTASGFSYKLSGFTRDIDAGLKLYFIAISQGDPDAESYAHSAVRELFFDEIKEGGNSVLPELRKAAEQGNPLAQSCVGEYYMGWGENIPEARKWLTKAAEYGIKTAERNLKDLR